MDLFISTAEEIQSTVERAYIGRSRWQQMDPVGSGLNTEMVAKSSHLN